LRCGVLERRKSCEWSIDVLLFQSSSPLKLCVTGLGSPS
jgi:hypothetical protein